MSTRFKLSTDIVDYCFQYIFEHDDLTQMNKSEDHLDIVLQLKFKFLFSLMDEIDEKFYENYIALMGPSLKAKMLKDIVDWGQKRFEMISRKFSTKFRFIIDHLLVDSVGILVDMKTIWPIDSQESAPKFDYFFVATQIINQADEESYKHLQKQVYNIIASLIWNENLISKYLTAHKYLWVRQFEFRVCVVLLLTLLL